MNIKGIQSIAIKSASVFHDLHLYLIVIFINAVLFYPSVLQCKTSADTTTDRDLHCPRVFIEPAYVEVCSGSQATFNAIPAGDPPFQFQWYNQNGIIEGATNAALTVNGTSSDYYYVIVPSTINNCRAAQSQPSELLVFNALSVSLNDTLICKGSHATLTAKTDSSFENTYLWNTGDTTQSITESNEALYCVTVTNKITGCQATGCGKIVFNDPVILNQPQSQNVCAGNAAGFKIKMTDNSASFTYEWYRNNQLLTTNTDSTGKQLLINNVSLADAGKYYCVISNSCSQVTSGIAVLTVEPVPQIDSQPVQQNVKTGGIATFSVLSSGALSYQWQVNGINIAGETGSSLSIDTKHVNSQLLLPGDLYRVHIESSCYTLISNEAALILNSPPSGFKSNPVKFSSAINWNNIIGSMQYEIEYWSNNYNHKTRQISSNRVNLTNLMPGTKYFYHVRTIYPTASAISSGRCISEWSEIQSFVTMFEIKSLSAESCKSVASLDDNAEGFNMNVYPNPSTGIVNITLPASDSKMELSVYNLANQMLFSKTISSSANRLQIDLSSYAKGLYLINLKNSVSNKFVKLIIQ